MFESAETGARVDKETFAAREPELRAQLLAAQRRLATSPLSAIVVIGGVEGAGKGEVLNLLLEWMDARGIDTHAPWTPTDEESCRPPMWRIWRLLPPAGSLGIFLGSWYTQPVIDRVLRRSSKEEFDTVLERSLRFERMLASEHTLLVKIWLHLSRKAQRRRLDRLEKDPEQSWRITELDRRFFKHYRRFAKVSEEALERTSTDDAPWTIIEAADRRHRNLAVATTLLEAMTARLDAQEAAASAETPPTPLLATPEPDNVLRSLDLGLRLEDEEADRRLLRSMGTIARRCRRLGDHKRSLVLVFEGPDAAGKGGAIRRVTRAIDARQFRVVPISAPTDEESARPYLWRFWRHVPGQGRVTIFDRSWYGRVLVERVEGLCPESDWRRAYDEINDFEEQLVDFGVLVLKFWLWITPEEQLRRFRDRQATAYKQYKITEDDWRNRRRWEAYEAAACDMIERTDTTGAPWTLVEADDKNWARCKVLETVARALDNQLDD